MRYASIFKAVLGLAVFGLVSVNSSTALAQDFAYDEDAQGGALQCEEGKVEVPPFGCLDRCESGWRVQTDFPEYCVVCDQNGDRRCRDLHPDGHIFE